MTSFDSIDLDTALADSGMVHTDSDNIDHNDSSALSKGYAYELTPLSMGLVGWWPLSWDSARDLSGEGNHGTLNGGVTTGVAGRGGLQAMSFDGADDNIHLGSNIWSNSTFSDGITVTCWVNQSDLGDGSRSYFLDSEGAIKLTNDDQTTGEMEFTLYDGSNTVTVGWGSGSNNTWHHVVGRWDGSTMYLYVDGEQRASTSFSGPIELDSLDRGVRFGSSFSGDTSHYDGVSADARVYDRPLSASEIQTLYEWGNEDLARPPTDGVSRYALDGDATDSWGSNDGTENGGLVYSSDAIRGQSGDFDGTDDYIEISDQSYASITVSAWFKWGGDTSTGRYIAAGGYDGTLTEWELWIDPSNSRLRWNTYDGSNSHGVTGPAIPSNEWMHALGVYDGPDEEYRLYVNGSLVGTSTDSYGPTNADNTEPYTIGGLINSGSPQNFFDGRLDDVRIYDYALSPEGVFENYLWGTRGINLNQFTVKH